MRKLMITAAVMGAAFALSACATVSKDECLAGNWFELGRTDGSAGRKADRLEKITKDCAKHNIVPDQAAYAAGWNQGVLSYCAPLNGFRIGRQGDRMSDICPATLKAAFADSHRLGRSLWTAEEDVKALEREVASLESRVTEIEIERDDLDCGALALAKRADCRSDRRDLTENLQEVRGELQDERLDLQRAREALGRTRTRVSREASTTIPGFTG